MIARPCKGSSARETACIPWSFPAAYISGVSPRRVAQLQMGTRFERGADYLDVVRIEP